MSITPYGASASNRGIARAACSANEVSSFSRTFADDFFGSSFFQDDFAFGGFPGNSMIHHSMMLGDMGSPFANVHREMEAMMTPFGSFGSSRLSGLSDLMMPRGFSTGIESMMSSGSTNGGVFQSQVYMESRSVDSSGKPQVKRYVKSQVKSGDMEETREAIHMPEEDKALHERRIADRGRRLTMRRDARTGAIEGGDEVLGQMDRAQLTAFEDQWAAKARQQHRAVRAGSRSRKLALLPHAADRIPTGERIPNDYNQPRVASTNQYM